jgi:methionyl-tRNA formyltransferase
MKLVYFGSGAFGLPTFHALHAAHEIVLAVTQPDKPAGRDRTLTPTPIAQQALACGVEVYKPESPNTDDAIARIHGAGAEAFVVIAYGHKLGVELLGDYFAINLHGSLLPKYRGAAPINWAVINGESETGITVITLSQTMDGGGMLAQRSLAIDPNDTAGELHDRMALLGPDAVLSTLDAFARDALDVRRQDEAMVTKAPKLIKRDGTVCFDQSAADVRNRIHGLTPWPGCAIMVQGKRLIVRRAAVENAADPLGGPGVVLEDGSIACAPGSVKLLEVVPPGKRSMTFEAFMNGYGVTPGMECTTL